MIVNTHSKSLYYEKPQLPNLKLSECGTAERQFPCHLTKSICERELNVKLLEHFATLQMLRFPMLFNPFPSWRVGGPCADILKTKDGFAIEMELPGVKKEDVQIGFEKDTLEIKATRKAPAIEGAKKQLSERRHGEIVRSFSIPTSCDVANMNATLEDGVLVLNIPKRESSKVEIKVN